MDLRLEVRQVTGGWVVVDPEGRPPVIRTLGDALLLAGRIGGNSEHVSVLWEDLELRELTPGITTAA